MENPSTSRIWLAPPVASLVRSAAWTCIGADFCQWGTPWRKRTAFLGPHIDLSRIIKVCTRSLWCCSKPARPHQALEGRAPDGRFWTAVAEAYPAQLCRSLASAFDDVVVCRKASAMQRAMSIIAIHFVVLVLSAGGDGSLMKYGAPLHTVGASRMAGPDSGGYNP
eukprot:3459844-Pyramimonas_sp.AAC.1